MGGAGAFGAPETGATHGFRAFGGKHRISVSSLLILCGILMVLSLKSQGFSPAGLLNILKAP